MKTKNSKSLQEIFAPLHSIIDGVYIIADSKSQQISSVVVTLEKDAYDNAYNRFANKCDFINNQDNPNGVHNPLKGFALIKDEVTVTFKKSEDNDV